MLDPVNTILQCLEVVLAFLLALLIFGNCLLFWPIYRLFHPRKTKRRHALFVTFLVQLCLYLTLTGLVVWGFDAIADLHNASLLIWVAYLLLDVACWVASVTVLARTPATEISSTHPAGRVIIAMKRMIFIVLWPAIFWILTVIGGMLGFDILGRSGMSSWNEWVRLGIGIIWSVIFFGVPVLGLILALLGKLPGTR